jgi:osmotically-inducible protein OsmY
MKTTLIRSTWVLTLAGALSACAPLMVGGMVGGAMVATDRRTSGIQLEDETIELKAVGHLRDTAGSRGHINVTSFNRQVLITGEVPSAQARDEVARLVAGLENVRKVVNELVIGPNSSLTDRSTDSLITAKVKAKMIDRKDIFANAFKIVTEREVVYLMGRVTQREADHATEVARQVSGVKKVVRIFEILTDAELNALQPAPLKN